MRNDDSLDRKAGLREAAHLLVARGWLVLVVGVLSAAVTGVIVELQPARYQAQAIISVGSAGSTDAALALATSDRVRQATAQLSGLPMDAAEWQAATSVDAPGGGLVRLWVVQKDGNQAVKTAASWGQALVGALTELQVGPAGNPGSAPRMVSQPAQATQLSSEMGLKMLTSGILGLVVGLIAVLTLRVAKTSG